MSEKLAVVMPVYNEEESVGKVFEEWLPALEALNIDFQFVAIDDGSKDNTLNILNRIAELNPNKVQVHHHENRGHGQSCIAGYELAMRAGFDYVLQIDSDGQCDAQYFKEFWAKRHEAPVFGYRNSRDDGQSRWWISRIVSLVGLMGTGTWVGDANVPYRLMKAEQLNEAIKDIPKDFHLANILISLKLRQKSQIQWVPIHFRDRFGGSASVKTFNFAQQGLKLLGQLWLS